MSAAAPIASDVRMFCPDHGVVVMSDAAFAAFVEETDDLMPCATCGKPLMFDMSALRRTVAKRVRQERPRNYVRTEDVTAFAASCEWMGVRSEENEFDAWLAARKTIVTASDMAAVLGEDPHRSALDVFLDKLTPPEEEIVPLDDPRFWGRVLEQPILEAVARYRGWKYRKGGALLRSRKHPFIGATLDAEVDTGDGVWIDLEGKTTRLPREWDEETGALPSRVLVQVQVQLLVTGAPLAIVFALLQGCRPVQIPIEPSPKFHEILVERAEEFTAMVKAGNPPLPDGSERAKRALDRLYPRENGSIVGLPREALYWTQQYQTISGQLKILDRRKKYYQQLLKHSMGAATFGVLPEAVGGKQCWRWETQQKPAYEVEEKETRVLMALKLPPAGSPRGRALPPANDTSLTKQLEESIERENIPKIRFGQRRKRAKR
jgi:putative phage-type endonuclease